MPKNIRNKAEFEKLLANSRDKVILILFTVNCATSCWKYENEKFYEAMEKEFPTIGFHKVNNTAKDVYMGYN